MPSSYKYHVRFIGATTLSFVSLAFEGHNLSIVEADGANYAKPVNTNFMQIGAGQRYSALLTTKTCAELQDQRRFWIQTETRDRPNMYRGMLSLPILTNAMFRFQPPHPLLSPIQR